MSGLIGSMQAAESITGTLSSEATLVGVLETNELVIEGTLSVPLVVGEQVNNL